MRFNCRRDNYGWSSMAPPPYPMQRDRFRAYVADHLVGCPSDTAVQQVINNAIDWMHVILSEQGVEQMLMYDRPDRVRRKNEKYIRVSDGREVDPSEALDNGILRSGFALRVPTMLRDGSPNGGFDRGAEGHCRDARGSATTAPDLRRRAHKPGFRTGVMRDAAALAHVQDCYEAYDREQAERYLHPGEAQTQQSDKLRTAAALTREDAYRQYDDEMASAYLRGE